jgi:hypothetical protein
MIPCESEDEGDTFLRNVGAHLQDNTVTTQKTTIGNFIAMRTSDL